MRDTEILEPLTCDTDEQKIHSEKLNRIKTSLAAMKPSDETPSMDDFLAALELDYDSYKLAIRSSLKTATTLIKRLPSEVRVNNYNIHTLQAWRANHDIQFILDIYACASYITSYIAKGERGMSDLLRNACEEAKLGNNTLKQQVRLIGNKFLNNVEISAQEAVYLLLQLPLKRSSRQIVFVNTSPPDERVYLLKSNIDQLDDDAEVAESNVLTRYSNRKQSLETVCLADYVASYDHVSNVRSSSNSDDEYPADDSTFTRDVKQPRRRKVPRVIRTFVINPQNDPEKAARQKLMLYLPWRNETTDLLGQYATFTEHLESVKHLLADKVAEFEPFEEEVTAAQDLLASADVEQQFDLLVPGVQHCESSAATAGTSESEHHTAIHPHAHGQSRDYDLALDLGLSHVTADNNSLRYNMPDDEFYHLMKSLNFEQLQFVYDTVHHLKTSATVMYRFLSGGAGTGKSYVLRALREMAERFYRSRAGENYEQNLTMTLAPTGKAAFIAGGATIHSVLHIPANQSLTFNRLDYESLNTLRTQISHINLWLIDEISMVGHRMLSFVDQRLQEVHNSRQIFGGTSVIAFGDLYQLPPVMDGFVFADLSSSASHVAHYNALAPNLWKENFTMFELTTIMRQQDSRSFAELLARVREGNQSSQDLNVLQSRVIAPDAANYPHSAQHLFKTNNQVETHNISVYERSTDQKYLIRSIDSVVGAISTDMASHILNIIPSDSRKTAQLPCTLPLAVGCRYEISVNVNVSDGLANGAGGIIKHIQLTTDNFTASGIVWMLFDDNNVGTRTRADRRTLFKSHIDRTWTPILPLSRQFQVGRSHSAQVLRKQFPLRQSAAKTIHRSQGDTIDQVVVDFTSSRKEPHIHYVGLSRVRTLEGLFILNLCENKNTHK